MELDNTAIDCLVTTSVLDEFKRATQALWRDLRFVDSDHGFDKNDIHDYMQNMMNSAMTKAEVEGSIKVENSPMIRAAVNYVKYRQGNGEHRKACEQTAIHLYSLDSEAVRVMRRELDKV